MTRGEIIQDIHGVDAGLRKLEERYGLLTAEL